MPKNKTRRVWSKRQKAKSISKNNENQTTEKQRKTKNQSFTKKPKASSKKIRNTDAASGRQKAIKVEAGKQIL